MNQSTATLLLLSLTLCFLITPPPAVSAHPAPVTSTQVGAPSHLHGAAVEQYPIAGPLPHGHHQFRERALLLLVLAFAILVILVGGTQGLRTILTVALTAGAILWVLIPALLSGRDPVATTILLSGGITVITLFSVGGASVKTLAAIAGTTGGVIVAGIVAVLAGEAVRLSIWELSDAQLLAQLPAGINVNYEGILFSGMIIGSLGAVMDVGMSISSAISEVKRANPGLGVAQLFASGMNVGRDIMGTMANTLILAYTGVTIPLLLMLTAHGTTLRRIVNVETITAEIIRMLAGSMGLILCIPITALVSASLMGFKR